eukprot:UN24476
MKIWDPVSWNCTHTLKEHTRCIWRMTTLPTGELVTQAYNEIRIWDLDTNSGLRCVSILKGVHTNDIYGVAVFDSTSEIVTISHDKGCVFWKQNNNDRTWSVTSTIDGIKSRYPYAIAITLEGNVVTGVCSSPYVVELWN